jgi:hypothetical protein
MPRPAPVRLFQDARDYTVWSAAIQAPPSDP